MIRIRASSPFAAARRTSRMRSTMPVAQAERGHEQLAEGLRPAEAAQIVEEIGDVGGDVRIGGEQAVVLVRFARSVML